VLASSGSLARAHRLAFALNVSAGSGDAGQTLSWAFSYSNALIFVEEPVLTVDYDWMVSERGEAKMMVAGASFDSIHTYHAHK
jgi:uncharacterized protein (DUF1015 family)